MNSQFCTTVYTSLEGAECWFHWNDLTDYVAHFVAVLCLSGLLLCIVCLDSLFDLVFFWSLDEREFPIII